MENCLKIELDSQKLQMSVYGINNVDKTRKKLLESGSYKRYYVLSKLIEKNYGKIDVKKPIEFLKTLPIGGSAMHSVVFDSSRLKIWIANRDLMEDTTKRYITYRFEEIA